MFLTKRQQTKAEALVERFRLATARDTDDKRRESRRLLDAHRRLAESMILPSGRSVYAACDAILKSYGF